MPKFPTYEGQQIAPAPLAGGNLTAAGNSPDAFGAGFGEATQAFGVYYQRAKTKADHVRADQALLEAAKAAEVEQIGHGQLRGQAAIEASSAVLGRYNETVDEIRGGLTGEQQAVFDSQIGREKLSLFSAVTRHTANEYNLLTDATQNGKMESYRQKATTLAGDGGLTFQRVPTASRAGGGDERAKVLDTRQIDAWRQAGLEQNEQYVRDNWQRLPLGEKQLEVMNEEWLSTFDADVVRATMSADDAEAASAYFDKRKSTMRDDERVPLESHVMAFKNDKDAEQAAGGAFAEVWNVAAMSSMARGDTDQIPTVSEQRKDGEQRIKDQGLKPEVEKAALKQFNQTLDAAVNREEERQTDIYNELYDEVRAGKPYATLDGAKLYSISPQRRDNLGVTWEEQLSGDYRVTDLKRKYELMDMAKDPLQRMKFATTNLREEPLSLRTVKEMSVIQDKILKMVEDADAEAAKWYETFLSVDERVAMEARKLPKGQQDAFREAVAIAQAGQQFDSKVKLDPLAVHELAKKMLAPTLIDAPYWGTGDLRAFELNLDNTQLDDVPEDKAKVIREEYIKAGVANITDEMIVREYILDVQLRGPDVGD